MFPFARCFAALALALPLHASTVWYVRDGAPPNGDGRSWAHAFATLQPALERAQSGDEVWLACGRYEPSAASSPAGIVHLFARASASGPSSKRVAPPRCIAAKAASVCLQTSADWWR